MNTKLLKKVRKAGRSYYTLNGMSESESILDPNKYVVTGIRIGYSNDDPVAKEIIRRAKEAMLFKEVKNLRELAEIGYRTATHAYWELVGRDYWTKRMRYERD